MFSSLVWNYSTIVEQIEFGVNFMLRQPLSHRTIALLLDLDAEWHEDDTCQ